MMRVPGVDARVGGRPEVLVEPVLLRSRASVFVQGPFAPEALVVTYGFDLGLRELGINFMRLVDEKGSPYHCSFCFIQLFEFPG